MKNITTKCGLSQKLKQESKKLHEQNDYQIRYYAWQPNFSKIGPQTDFFSLKI